LRAALALAFALFAGTCSGFGGRVQADHARIFGCQPRWVSIEETGPDAYRATGCGFQSEWTCRRERGAGCTMGDHRAYGMDSP
jgi:hypothetical protein